MTSCHRRKLICLLPLGTSLIPSRPEFTFICRYSIAKTKGSQQEQTDSPPTYSDHRPSPPPRSTSAAKKSHPRPAHPAQADSHPPHPSYPASSLAHFLFSDPQSLHTPHLPLKTQTPTLTLFPSSAHLKSYNTAQANTSPPTMTGTTDHNL